MHPIHHERVDEADEQRTGVVRLVPDAVVPTVAHELGHVMATKQDLLERYAPDVTEVDGRTGWWNSESTADYHAFRWGFEEQIRAHHLKRNDEYPPLPGDSAMQLPDSIQGQDIGSLGSFTDTEGWWWRVDDNFVFHYCVVCAPDAEGCEHSLKECVSNKPKEVTREQLAGFEPIKKRVSKYKITTVTPDDG
jgi:hypothetical protein